MKNNYIIFISCFLISFIQINSDDSQNNQYSIYDICPAGKYGYSCNLTCSCDKWSTSHNCSRIDGRCLDCRFGHFDTNCENICYPTCKSNLCCAIKNKSFKTTNKQIKSNITMLSIQVGNKNLSIYPDYNVGYPLTIFRGVIIGEDIKNCNQNENNYQYTKFKLNNPKKCDVTTISIKNSDGNYLTLNLSVLYDQNPTKENIDELEYDGVIGLGFSNSLNIHLLENKDISLNIASYKVKNDQINILFGNLFKDEKKFVNALSYCNATVETSTTHTVMKCKVEGMRSDEYPEALELNDIEISFSLHEKTSLVLPSEERYQDYITKYYFINGDFEPIKVNDSKTYFCYKSKKINKLNDFGFVINKYYYSYKADRFFYEDKDSCPNNYLKFLIEFTNKTEDAKVIFGKTFFKDVELTIDNEEKKMYFYSKNVNYFSGEFVEKGNNKFSLSLDPLASSLITIGVIFLVNVISFLIYFYCKRKKSK